MQRLTGWEPAPDSGTREVVTAAVAPRGFYLRRDRQAFPDVYADIDKEIFGGRQRPMAHEITSPITLGRGRPKAIPKLSNPSGV
jgi:hypothetical protein